MLFGTGVVEAPFDESFAAIVTFSVIGLVEAPIGVAFAAVRGVFWVVSGGLFTVGGPPRALAFSGIILEKHFEQCQWKPFGIFAGKHWWKFFIASQLCEPLSHSTQENRDVSS